jgi:hypothetical protein
MIKAFIELSNWCHKIGIEPPAVTMTWSNPTHASAAVRWLKEDLHMDASSDQTERWATIGNSWALDGTLLGTPLRIQWVDPKLADAWTYGVPLGWDRQPDLPPWGNWDAALARP